MNHYTLEQLRALSEDDAMRLQHAPQAEVPKRIRSSHYHTLKLEARTLKNPCPLAKLIGARA